MLPDLSRLRLSPAPVGANGDGERATPGRASAPTPGTAPARTPARAQGRRPTRSDEVSILEAEMAEIKRLRDEGFLLRDYSPDVVEIANILLELLSLGLEHLRDGMELDQARGEALITKLGQINGGRKPLPEVMRNALQRLVALVNAGEQSESEASTEPGRSRAERAPKKQKAPDKRSIVGRATDVRPTGQVRHSFLVFDSSLRPPNNYLWYVKERMERNPSLKALIDAFAVGGGNTGDDPSGKGWVTKVVSRKGPQGRYRFVVRWTVFGPNAQNIPALAAQDGSEGLLRGRFVQGAQEMIDSFVRKLRRGAREGDDSDASSDSDSDDDGGGGDDDDDDAVSLVQPPRAPKNRSALRWDTRTGRPKVSLRLAIENFAKGHNWTVDVLIEWTLNRIWALRSRWPPAAGEDGAPTQRELQKLGKDLFEINYAKLKRDFEREKEEEAKETAEAAEAAAAAAAEEGDAEEDEDEEEEEEQEDTNDFDEWKKDREEELWKDAVAAWEQARGENVLRLELLQIQLAALKVVKDSGGSIGDVDLNTIFDEDVAFLIQKWKDAENGQWPSDLAKPRLKLPRIRDFLSTPYRSQEAKNWLKLQRDEHSKKDKEQHQDSVFGSAYSSSWDRRPTPTNTPPDHVSPVRWYEGSKLLIECGEPAQLPAVVMSRLTENSAKGDKALDLFSSDGATDTQGVWAPQGGVSDEKVAMLAKTLAWVWLLYPLISNKNQSLGIGTYGTSTGCWWYGSTWKNKDDEPDLSQAARRAASDFERRMHLLTLGMARWRVCNPLVFDSKLLDENFERLLVQRFKVGEENGDKMPKLVDAVLQASVSGAPT